MTERTNTYFEGIEKGSREFHRERQIRQDVRIELVKAEDWDAVKAWDEKGASISFPFTHGQMQAFYNWSATKDLQSFVENHVDALEVSDLPWDEDAHDFITCLKEAGVTEIAITDESTALMRLLHAFEDEGCRLYGLCKVTRTEHHWGELRTEEYNGILMKLD